MSAIIGAYMYAYNQLTHGVHFFSPGTPRQVQLFSVVRACTSMHVPGLQILCDPSTKIHGDPIIALDWDVINERDKELEMCFRAQLQDQHRTTGPKCYHVSVVVLIFS